MSSVPATQTLSDTPRTDELLNRLHLTEWLREPTALMNHARNLERELAAARSEKKEPLTVWVVQNRSSTVMFATQALAQEYVSKFPITAGLAIYPASVISSLEVANV